MEINNQVIGKISQANNILIIAGSSSDSLAASLALGHFLKKLEKEVLILSAVGKTNKLGFLNGFDQVKEQLDAVKSFVIDLSTKKAEVLELSYKKEPQQLSIFIKPKSGQFEPADVTFRNSNFAFELTILIGIESLDRLGALYSSNTELFFETPMINIDYHGTNENYAQFNLVNLSATSNSEIVFDLVKEFEESIIDDVMATQLLAGIISETDSFQHVRTTPQTFLKASQLVTMGANQQEIISRFYKSKSLGLLKLWGRVLARLKQETSIGLVYSTVNEQDLAKSEASAEDAENIIKEMSMQLSFAKLFLFFKQLTERQTTVYFHATIPVNPVSLFGKYNPQPLNGQMIKFIVDLPATEAEQQIIDFLKTNLPVLY